MGRKGGCRLSALGLGLSLGVLCGLSLLIMGLLAHNYGEPFVATTHNFLFLGYGPSIQASLIGGLMGFIHGLVTGVLVAWLYNLFSGCTCCCCTPTCTTTTKTTTKAKTSK